MDHTNQEMRVFMPMKKNQKRTVKRTKAHPHGPSVKKNDTYEALKRKGMSKSRAAAIANKQAKRG